MLMSKRVKYCFTVLELVVINYLLVDKTAGNLITKELKAFQDEAKLKDEYESSATDLMSWIAQSKDWLQVRRIPFSTVDEVEKKLTDFDDYTNNTKSQKNDEKDNLETTYTNLQTKLSLSNRPPFIPSKGKLLRDIGNAWTELETAEKEYEEWLLSELRRFDRINYLLKKCFLKIGFQSDWMKGKLEPLESDDYKNTTLQGVKILLKKHEVFENELLNNQAKIDEILVIAQHLNDLEYHDAGFVINNKLRVIVDDGNELLLKSKEWRANLEKMEGILETIQQQHLEFFKSAPSFADWMNDHIEEQNIPFFFNTNAIASQNSFKATLVDAKKMLDNLLAILKNVEKIQKDHEIDAKIAANPYTTLTAQDLESQWKKLNTVVTLGDSKLSEELEKQKKHEQLRIKFANVANDLVPWYRESTEDLMTSKMPATIEDIMTKAHGYESGLLSKKSQLVELVGYNQEMQKLRVFDNPFTPYTMHNVRLRDAYLKELIVTTTNQIEDRILIRDSKRLTQEQINSCSTSFQRFHVDFIGKLDKEELQKYFTSLGYKLNTETLEGKAEFQRILSFVDPTNSSVASFLSCLNFLVRESTDTDNAQQLIEAFRTLASNKTYITPDELRRELPPDQAEYCISRMSAYRGTDAPPNALDYHSLTTAIYGKSGM